jgi:hypothetical protein
MNPRYDANGTLSFWMVLPSKNLRNLVYARLRQQYPQLNYCCEWKDVHGCGLHLTVCEWNKSGMYHVPS